MTIDTRSEQGRSAYTGRIEEFEGELVLVLPEDLVSDLKLNEGDICAVSARSGSIVFDRTGSTQ
jgi:hypothetical protein